VGTRIEIGREICGMIQNEIIQPGTGRHHKEKEEIEKGMIPKREKAFKILYIHTCIQMEVMMKGVLVKAYVLHRESHY
jgi:hypothetical protein